jgi:hypothetical protein
MKKNSFLICKAAADCDKKCKVECIPTEEECPAVAELETALWVKEGWKVMNQYVNKQNALDESARTGSRKARNAEKDGIIEIKGEKWLNKLVKKERKKYLKRQRLLEKGRKSRERSAKAGRRNWNKKHKALLAFYASVEEKYKSICPDLNLYGGLSGSDQYFYNSVGGVLPPRYVYLPDWKKCISTESIGSADCIPKNRPVGCSSKDGKLTWAKLSTGFYELSTCSEE